MSTTSTKQRLRAFVERIEQGRAPEAREEFRADDIEGSP